MPAVSDTTTLNYLVLIEQMELLPKLFGKVFIPHAVEAELLSSYAPAQVRSWMAEPPIWLSTRAVMATAPVLPRLHAGEAEAIALALSMPEAVLLIDESFARAVARAAGIKTMGTLRILAKAHQAELSDFERNVDALMKTSFRATEKLIEQFRQELRTR